MTEKGSREWYLALPDDQRAHGRAWYEADGAPTAAALPPMRRVFAAVAALSPFPPRAPLGFMLDWSGARLSDAQLVEAVNAGARAASRYIAPPISSTAWKRITPAERDQILRRMDLWLNWEWYAGRCLEGASAGTQDAKWMNDALNAIGYPSGRVVPVSHDTGVINDPAVKAYYGAVRKTLDGKWGLTCYGSYHTVGMLVAAKLALPVAWQTKAWSGTNIAPSTMISNYQNTNQWFGGSVDENVIKAWPFGAWKSPYPPPPPPLDWLDMATEAQVRKIIRDEVLAGLVTFRWGDNTYGYTADQMEKLTHARFSLGELDAVKQFGRQGGFFVRFTDAPKAPEQVYLFNGTHLYPIDAGTWTALQDSENDGTWKLQSPVLLTTASNLYLAVTPPGISDPRI